MFSLIPVVRFVQLFTHMFCCATPLHRIDNTFVSVVMDIEDAMLYYVVCFGGAYAIIKDVLYCIVCLGRGVNKRLSRMLCCIVLYVWGVHKRLSRMLCCIVLYILYKY